MNWETLLCIGDSITRGARSYLGYPEYAGYILEERLGKYWNIINESKCGYTTIDLCRMVSDDFHNLKTQGASMITIMTGTNDIKHHVAEEDFMVAYSQLITKVRLLSQNITLIKIPAFSRGIMYPYNYGMNEAIHKFNVHIEALATKHSVRYLEFSWQEEWLYDGVHLNECGSKNIGVQLANYILKDKGFGTHDE